MAFSSPGALYRYFGGQVTEKTIRDALAHVDSYTLHREYKQPAVYNPYYAYRRRTRFQADLIDISKLKASNRGTTFLLVVIDIFTRKIWVMPLARKTAEATAEGLSSWLESMREEEGDADGERFFLTDSGKEFLNARVRALMRDNNVTMEIARNINKAAVVERVNKSLQVLIYKYLTDRGETKYIDILPALVSGYNNRKHRSLNFMTPNEADRPRNENRVRAVQTQRYAKNVAKRSKGQPKFVIGDMVRIKTYAKAPSSARRAYLPQFHGEYFKVIGINRRMPITMYQLRSMDTEEDIEGGFYANELTLVKGESFKIERIIRQRGRAPNREYFVKWKYFSPRWNSWVREQDVEQP